VNRLQSIRQEEKENKKRGQSWEIRVFDGNFENGAAGLQLGLIGFDWVCFSPRLQSHSFS
jgi:hypothetical protein